MFIKAELSFPSGVEQDIYNIRVVNVGSIEFQPMKLNTLDENPNVGHGLRIFPEKKTPDDDASKLATRKEVRCWGWGWRWRWRGRRSRCRSDVDG